jgi:hypothetical protein
MATCSTGHSDPQNRCCCGRCQASPVALDWGLWARRSTAGVGRGRQRSRRDNASARWLPPMAVSLFFVVIAAVISLAATVAIFDPLAPIRGRSASARPAQPSERTQQLSANDPSAGLLGRAATRGTDLKGFLGYPGARCDSANPAVAIGRTSTSLMVVCQNYSGRFYYKGFALRTGLSVEIENVVRDDDKFTAFDNGARCVVSPVALIITTRTARIRVEPMLEYWSV